MPRVSAAELAAIEAEYPDDDQPGVVMSGECSEHGPLTRDADGLERCEACEREPATGGRIQPGTAALASESGCCAFRLPDDQLTTCPASIVDVYHPANQSKGDA